MSVGAGRQGHTVEVCLLKLAFISADAWSVSGQDGVIESSVIPSSYEEGSSGDPAEEEG